MRNNSRPVQGVMVEINSRGGNVKAAIAIGRLLRKERLPLLVDRGAICASSCVFILAGAVHRLINGQVAIHRPFLGVNTSPTLTADQIRRNYERNLLEVRAYLREMNVAERFADDMFAVNPETARFLSSTELAGYGLVETDSAEQEVLDVQEAQRLGIDRLELMRRKLRVQQTCAQLQGREHIRCKRSVMAGG